MGNIKLLSPFAKMTSSTSLPDWTAEKITSEINKYRQDNKLPVLSSNADLAKAAKARLAVMTQYQDVSGDITGLSREKALDDVGYSYSWVGDLPLIDFFRTSDPVSFWANQPNGKSTLNESHLKEIGVAVKQNGAMMDIYVMLATKKSQSAVAVSSKITWGGPDLWEAINKRRVELGVNPLKQKDELCTIAAIRLNQILELGKLDGHAGFEPTLERDDLKWIAQKYNISEFLVSGYATPQDAVAAWENTLGHRKLLAGGEYVWGCVYAQNGFGVAIAAY